MQTECLGPIRNPTTGGGGIDVVWRKSNIYCWVRLRTYEGSLLLLADTRTYKSVTKDEHQRTIRVQIHNECHWSKLQVLDGGSAERLRDGADRDALGVED